MKIKSILLSAMALLLSHGVYAQNNEWEKLASAQFKNGYPTEETGD